MSGQYTSDGKRRSSMTHARHAWTCPCGREVRGNGGKSSHQRACLVWAREALRIAEQMLAALDDRDSVIGRSSLAGERRARWTAERDELRKRPGIADEIKPQEG